MNTQNTIMTAFFGGGSFWTTEAIFERVSGVKGVTCGYAGGVLSSPSYREVCSGKTGHAEVVQVKFDSSSIAYEELLEIFFATHDPTTINQQGVDKGSQYRSIVLCANEKQYAQAQEFIAFLERREIFDKQIVTEIKMFDGFFEAEYYQQNYYSIHAGQPYARVIIDPKLAKLHRLYERKLKTFSNINFI